jgi:membrane protein
MMPRWSQFREAGFEWARHNAPRLGAALAYYTVLSLAPTLVLVVAISSFAFGDEAVRGQLYWQIKDLVGNQGAIAVQTMLKNAHLQHSGILATVLGLSTLLLGASGVFGELRDTLNFIWGAPSEEGFGIWNTIRYRFFSFAMVVGIGFLMMVSLAVSALIQAMGDYVGRFISLPAPMLEMINFVITFVVTAFLFALIYRIVPDVKISWGDVAIGSVATAALFSLGKFLIGLYLGKASVGSAYGAAGSLVVLLVWVYYSAQIFLYGAEFTRVYARDRGSPAAQRPSQTQPAPPAGRLQPHPS